MFPYSSEVTRGFSGILLALLAAATALAAMTSAPARARAEPLIVKYDQSQILRMPRPVAEIIIGNPMIADVAIQAANLLVVTGKSFGVTNIIALDAERNIIQDQLVMVHRETANIVRLTKGAQRESWNCSPQCNPTLTLGDDQKFFSAHAADAQKKIKMSESQTDGTSFGGAQ